MLTLPSYLVFRNLSNPFTLEVDEPLSSPSFQLATRLQGIAKPDQRNSTKRIASLEYVTRGALNTPTSQLYPLRVRRTLLQVRSVS